VEVSDLVPHVFGDRPKRLELCDLMEHTPEPIVYTLVISRKIMAGRTCLLMLVFISCGAITIFVIRGEATIAAFRILFNICDDGPTKLLFVLALTPLHMKIRTPLKTCGSHKV
jgi:hypothetical protein